MGVELTTGAGARRRAVSAAGFGRGLPVVLDTRVVSGSGGGPDKTILNQPRLLAPAGYRNVCAYMHPPDDPGFEQLRRKAEVWQAPLVSIPDRGPWDWRVVSELLALCRREGVQIWHGHDYKSNALGLLLRRFWPMRLVTTVHGWGVNHTRRTALYYLIDRLCLARYEKVVCVSADLEQQARAAGVPRERRTLIENGIDVQEFTRKTDVPAAKRRQGIDPARLVVGAVGRLSPEKGFDLLIRAAAQLLRRGIDLELVIVGEGEERPRLASLVGELALGGRVRLLGYRADVREVFEATDCCALSSLSEGLPNVLLEAMALEVPVAATAVGGVPRLIADGVNGLLVGRASVDGLAQALGRLLCDAGLRSRLGLAGRKTVETRFSFAARMEKIRAIYDGLLGRN